MRNGKEMEVGEFRDTILLVCQYLPALVPFYVVRKDTQGIPEIIDPFNLLRGDHRNAVRKILERTINEYKFLFKGKASYLGDFRGNGQPDRCIKWSAAFWRNEHDLILDTMIFHEIPVLIFN